MFDLVASRTSLCWQAVLSTRERHNTTIINSPDGWDVYVEYKFTCDGDRSWGFLNSLSMSSGCLLSKLRSIGSSAILPNISSKGLTHVVHSCTAPMEAKSASILLKHMYYTYCVLSISMPQPYDLPFQYSYDWWMLVLWATFCSTAPITFT